MEKREDSYLRITPEETPLKADGDLAVSPSLDSYSALTVSPRATEKFFPTAICFTFF